MSEPKVCDSDKPNVVCADVDGSLLATDLLYETLLFAIKSDLAVLLYLPFWLLRGRAYLKRQLARRSEALAIELLPVNAAVVNYLRAAAEAGRRVLLASASDVGLLQRLAEQFDFVSGVIGSDGDTNKKGRAKSVAIREVIGDSPWEYIGDSNADFAVWRDAQRVVCVTGSSSFRRRVLAKYPNAQILEREPRTLRVFLLALRAHQWAKNVLVFLPLILAHQIFNTRGWLMACVAAIAFSLCASGVYLINDLLDLEADRRHPRKRKRPCASGRFPIHNALILAPILFVSAFAVSISVKLEFAVMLGLYFILTSAYSYRLKALALVDVILLAILYTIRIVGGGLATGVHVSQWLLGLSMFIFFSLACVKRFSELLVLQQRKEHRTWGRGYAVSDMEQVASFGTASGYIAVLVLALYVSGREVAELYNNPAVIWMGCPLLLYWISRIWLLARRGLVHDDPLVFALRDRVTYAVAAIGAVIFIGAKW